MMRHAAIESSKAMSKLESEIKYPGHDIVVQTVDKVRQPHSENMHAVNASLSGHVLIKMKRKLCPRVTLEPKVLLQV